MQKTTHKLVQTLISLETFKFQSHVMQIQNFMIIALFCAECSTNHTQKQQYYEKILVLALPKSTISSQ